MTHPWHLLTAAAILGQAILAWRHTSRIAELEAAIRLHSHSIWHQPNDFDLYKAVPGLIKPEIGRRKATGKEDFLALCAKYYDDYYFEDQRVQHAKK